MSVTYIWNSFFAGGGGVSGINSLGAYATYNALITANPPNPSLNDTIAYVSASTGVYLVNRKNKGWYICDGTSWEPWEYDSLAADILAQHLVDSSHVPPHVIEDEGTPLTQRSNINFTGTGISAADSGGKTVVSVDAGLVSDLSTPPALPSVGFQKLYYDSNFKCIMMYDSTRSKWLSAETFIYIVSRTGNTGAGISLQSSGGVPTSTSPLHLGSENVCLVSVAVTTGATEDFTLGISDTSTGGSGTTYTKVITSGIDFVDDTVNQNFAANDTIDIFVSAVGGSGNINNLVVVLKFKKRI